MAVEPEQPVELVILDFEGVCTPSHAELLDQGVATLAIPVRPECEELVSDLANAGIATAVLSNEISAEWVDRVPLLAQVDHVINCADNKIYKPDRRAFQRCCLVAGVAAEATLVIDDGVDNVLVARTLGMAAELFDPSEPQRSWARARAHVWPRG